MQFSRLLSKVINWKNMDKFVVKERHAAYATKQMFISVQIHSGYS